MPGGGKTENEGNHQEKGKCKKSRIGDCHKKDLLQYVKSIRKIGGRTIEIRIETGASIKDMSILNTYAPNMGYDIETINNYWDKTKAYISLVPRKYIKIWRTGNNGQVYRTERMNT